MIHKESLSYPLTFEDLLPTMTYYFAIQLVAQRKLNTLPPKTDPADLQQIHNKAQERLHILTLICNKLGHENGNVTTSILTSLGIHEINQINNNIIYSACSEYLLNLNNPTQHESSSS